MATLTDFPTHRVLYSAGPAGPWAEQPHLRCRSATRGAAPDVDRADFVWHCGEIKQQGEPDFALWSPRDARGKFIRVQVPTDEVPTDEVPADETWTDVFIGVVEDDVLTFDRGDSTYADQYFTAFGLALLLYRRPITTMAVDLDGSVRYVTRSEPFNELRQRGFVRDAEGGNRTHIELPGVLGWGYAFSDGEGDRWNVTDAVQHLVTFHTPASPAWTLTGDAGVLEALAVVECPAFDPVGSTVWEALYQLLSPAVGVGFEVRFDNPDSLQPQVHVFSLSNVPVPLVASDFGSSTGGTLPPATTQIAVDASDPDMKNVRIIATARQRYGKIEVLGDPIVSVFTSSFADGTLKPGWSDALEQRYLAGSGNPDDAAEIHDLARLSDELEPVYRRFLIDASALSTAETNPYLDDDARSDGTVAIIRHGRRNERLLPILPIKLPVAEQEESGQDYRLPMIVAQDLDDRWFFIHLGDGVEIPSVGYKLLDAASGFELETVNANLIAATAFGDDADPKPARTAVNPLWDYHTMLATFAAYTDTRLRVVRTIPGGDPDRVLLIEPRDAALHIIDPGAIVALEPDASGTVTAAAAGYHSPLRDDSARLRNIADAAAVWFAGERNRLEFALTRIDTSLTLGTLVTQIAPVPSTGTVPINSTLTSISFDFEHGETAVTTDTGDPDFAGFG